MDAQILDVAATWDDTITSSLLSITHIYIHLWINLAYEKLQEIHPQGQYMPLGLTPSFPHFSWYFSKMIISSIFLVMKSNAIDSPFYPYLLIWITPSHLHCYPYFSQMIIYVLTLAMKKMQGIPHLGSIFPKVWHQHVLNDIHISPN